MFSSILTGSEYLYDCILDKSFQFIRKKKSKNSKNEKIQTKSNKLVSSTVFSEKGAELALLAPFIPTLPQLPTKPDAERSGAIR